MNHHNLSQISQNIPTQCVKVHMFKIFKSNLPYPERILRFLHNNLTTDIYLPGGISIMEDLWVMVCCIEAIQREKETCN